MPVYKGVVVSGSNHSSETWGWMDQILRKKTKWHRVENGTLNVKLADFVAYTNNRRIDFSIPRTASPLAPWNCDFQRCEIISTGRKLPAVIATTGDDHWGKKIGAIEIRSAVNLRTALGLTDGTEIEITMKNRPLVFRHLIALVTQLYPSKQVDIAGALAFIQLYDNIIPL